MSLNKDEMKWISIKNKMLDKLNLITFLPELLSCKRKIYVYYAIPRWTKKYNWGDDVTPELVKLISSRQVIPYQFCWFKHKYYLCVGSIIQWNLDTNSIIWGSGLLYPVNYVKPPKKVLAVRGPLTRKCLLENGISCPPVYGDPVLLFPRFYYPKIEKKYKYGLICHESEIQEISISQKELEDCLFIDIKNYPTWHSFIDQILSCEMILSSSLHGVIVADAYGVPNLWCKFTNYEAPGNGFKFRDYYLSVGKSIDAPLDMQNKDLNEVGKIVLDKWKNPVIDLDMLLEVCPFKKNMGKARFLRMSNDR